jgi:hypothetical protein
VAICYLCQICTGLQNWISAKIGKVSDCRILPINELKQATSERFFMLVISGRANSILAVVLIALLLAACGGGGGSSAPAPTPTSHTVDISWTANRETAVNTTGGGYIVAVSGQAPIDVPWVSGPSAPTTVSTTLLSGSYTVTVTAYSALNPPGGVSGSTSLPSTTYNFTVPY